MADSYTRIASIDDLLNVSKVIIASDYLNKPFVMSTEYNTNNRPATLGDYDANNNIVFNDNMLLLDVEYDEERDAFLFSYFYTPIEEVSLRYYLTGVVGNSNRLRSTTTLSDSCYFYIDFDEDRAIITCADENVTRNTMKFNTQNQAFALYLDTFAGIEVNIYKKYEPVVHRTSRNHVIDPTFLWQAIEIFSFNYNFYRLSKQEIDENYEQHQVYEHFVIRGSLQSQGSRIVQTKNGNYIDDKTNFYCKSIYQIEKGDLIHYKHKLYRVDDVTEDYDEYGVRACKLTMVQLSAYEDLAEYIKMIEGVDLI